jgi:hypothetical protein
MDDLAALTWLERAASVSLFLVAVGVVGEFLIHRIEGPVRRRIEAAKDLEIARLNKDAEEAKQLAADANARAANAELEGQKEKLKRVELESRLAWRRISPAVHDSLLQILKAHAGAVVEVTEMGDIEARTFATDIVKTFRDSGWVVHVNGVGVVSPPQYGVQCSVNDAFPAGKALETALLKIVPTAKIQLNKNLTIVGNIFVALKPPP